MEGRIKEFVIKNLIGCSGGDLVNAGSFLFCLLSDLVNLFNLELSDIVSLFDS